MFAVWMQEPVDGAGRQIQPVLEVNEPFERKIHAAQLHRAGPPPEVTLVRFARGLRVTPVVVREVKIPTEVLGRWRRSSWRISTREFDR